MEEAPQELWQARLFELLEQARLGSKEAKDEIFRNYMPRMLAVARRKIEEKLQSKIGGSDLVQETFLAAAQDFASFAGQTDEELQDWLWGIMQNKWKEYRRRYRRAGRDVGREVPLTAGDAVGRTEQLSADQWTPEEIASEEERRLAVECALERLPAGYASVLRLHLWQGLSFPEIGEIFGCTEEAARSEYRRALERLYEDLGGESQAESSPPAQPVRSKRRSLMDQLRRLFRRGGGGQKIPGQIACPYDLVGRGGTTEREHLKSTETVGAPPRSSLALARLGNNRDW